MKRFTILFLLPLLLFAQWNEFSHALFNTLDDENRIISPYSVQSALMMTYYGAKGETRDELQGALLLKDDLIPPEISSPSIHIANSIWIDTDYNLLTSYQEIIQDAFDTSIHSLSFSDVENARNMMNAWVEKEHDGAIKEVIEEDALDENTRMTIFNTIHIKDEWLYQFDKNKTTLSVFYGNTEERPINMMQQQTILPYCETPHCQATLLPFSQDRRFAAVFVLPKDGCNLEMHTLPLDKWVYKSVDLRVPKFKLKTKNDLLPSLKALGLNIALTNRADFSGLTGYPSLKIDKIFTSTGVEIDESGISATAATGVTFGLKSSLVKPEKTFLANRPFGFMVIDTKTKVILFMGEVCQP
ncbi:MAG: serpin family protein [Simkaniaceae bacterium]|nr:serpin family protein [Simkaniaceae bacterium]